MKTEQVGLNEVKPNRFLHADVLGFASSAQPTVYFTHLE
jgi:hypothetical protein